MLRWLIGGVVVAGLVVGLAAFEPWRLFTSSRVDEPLPTSGRTTAAAGTSEPSEPSAPTSSSAPKGSTDPTEATTSASPTPPAQDRVLAVGDFEDAEHATTGTARLLELGDGRRFVRLEGLATSDGPDLHVWLTDQPSGGEWGSYDDGHVVGLGDLRATHGNQNYAIPAAADLGPVTSVVIWCDRFNVAFGTAPLQQAS